MATPHERLKARLAQEEEGVIQQEPESQQSPQEVTGLARLLSGLEPIRDAASQGLSALYRFFVKEPAQFAQESSAAAASAVLGPKWEEVLKERGDLPEPGSVADVTGRVIGPLVPMSAAERGARALIGAAGKVPALSRTAERFPSVLREAGRGMTTGTLYSGFQALTDPENTRLQDLAHNLAFFGGANVGSTLARQGLASSLPGLPRLVEAPVAGLSAGALGTAASLPFSDTPLSEAPKEIAMNAATMALFQTALAAITPVSPPADFMQKTRTMFSALNRANTAAMRGDTAAIRAASIDYNAAVNEMYSVARRVDPSLPRRMDPEVRRGFEEVLRNATSRPEPVNVTPTRAQRPATDLLPPTASTPSEAVTPRTPTASPVSPVPPPVTSTTPVIPPQRVPTAQPPVQEEAPPAVEPHAPNETERPSSSPEETTSMTRVGTPAVVPERPTIPAPRERRPAVPETPATPVPKPVPVRPVSPDLPTVPDPQTKRPVMPPIAQGVTAQAWTERGTPVDTQYAVFEADQLVSSHDTSLRPDHRFPEELQPRDRTRAASELQISRMVNDLRPEFLADSRKVSEGAPIVGPDLIVESGNARTIALKSAYEQNRAERYREFLLANAERFGLDPSAIAQAERPILVRVRLSDVDRRQFVVEANEPSVASMSATEQALSDAERLSDGLMALFRPSEEGEIINPDNREFISAFFGEVVSPSERGKYLTEDGQLSQEGVNRIRNAVFAKAYGDSDAIAHLAESTDSNVRNITGGMLIAAPRIADLRAKIASGSLFNLDPASDISAAMRKLSELRASGHDVESYLRQESMFGSDLSPLATNFLEVFDANKRSRHRIANILTTYVDIVEALGDPRQVALFEGIEPPTPQDILIASVNRVTEALRPPSGDLFDTDPEPQQAIPAEGERVPPAPLEPDSATIPQVPPRDAQASLETGEGREAIVTPSVAQEGVVGTPEPSPDEAKILLQEAEETTDPQVLSNIREMLVILEGEGSEPVRLVDERIRSVTEVEAMVEPESTPPSDDLADSQVVPQTYSTEPSESAPAPQVTPTSQPRVLTEEVTTPTVETEPSTPSAQIAAFVRDQLSRGEAFTSDQLFRAASEAYGGTQAENAFTSKDAYDAMELGVNQFLADNAQGIADPTVEIDQALRNLEAIRTSVLDNIPSQTRRTEEADEFQQFSTPPPLAYLANWVAGVTPQDVVLEPSAGIGGLAVFAKNAGAEVIVNELSPRRAEILEEMGFDRVFTENAEQLNNILPPDVKPTLVIMNPPFSATAGRKRGERKSINVTMHLDQALKRLEPGGRLVAIVGRGMRLDAPTFRAWWDKTKKDYRVLANIGLSGKNFTRYGTQFDTRLLVIDKDGPTAGFILTEEFEDLGQALRRLEMVRNERILPRGPRVEPTPGQSGGRAVSDPSQDPGLGRPPVSPSTDPLGTPREGSSSTRPTQPVRDERPGGVRSEVVSRTPESGDGPPAQSGSDRGRDVGDTGRAPQPQESGGGVTVPSGDAEGSARRQTTSDGPRLVEPTGEQQSSPQELTDSVYVAYRPAKVRIEGAVPHPGQLAESAAMGAVLPPDPTYTPNLPADVIRKGLLSDAQLESVVYAGQAHQQLLPDGQRRGFFIGDGTGVGKGRQIAGIILDNFRNGRTKAVWVSKNMPLYNDARRDVSDLGGDPDEVIAYSKIKLGEPIKQERGVLFTTYHTLARGSKVTENGGLAPSKSGVKSRLDTLVDWLGEDFDGVIVFDEAHEMKSSLPIKGKIGTQKPAAKALAGVDLQQRLPNARIVYVSATGASDVANLAYAERLGLWGQGTSFADKNDFINKIGSSGLAALELVARDMKALGSYLARSLSYDDVTYGTIEHTLTPEQVEMYDTMATSWQIVLQNMDKALEETGQAQDGRARGRALAQFWSSHQRFFNQVITSLQMPSVIDAIKKDLSDGKAVVLQLVNTNEAAQNRALASQEEGDTLEDLDLTPRMVLAQFLEKGFPIHQYEEYVDENGVERTRLVTDSAGNPVINQEALARRDELLDQLGAIRIPEGPLEILLNTFGTEQVAEVTGRTQRVVRDPDTGEAVIENRTERHATADADAFMNDRKRILVFSNAGGTGRSYHADLRAKNQRPRVHYLLQPGWIAENAVQGFGRTHRTNQASAPHYNLVTTNLMGQKRFISSIARRLDQLGALTRGQRQTGSQGMFSARDNLESSLAYNALEAFYKDLVNEKFDLGIGPKELLDKMGLGGLLDEHGNLLSSDELRNMPRFLNRILSLETDLQNRTFSAFHRKFEEVIERAEADGTLDVGMENLRADSIDIVEEKTVHTSDSGAETKYVQLRAGTRIQPMLWDEALDAVEVGDGFFAQNKRSKRVYGFVPAGSRTLQSGSVVDRYRRIRPDGLRDYVDASYVEGMKRLEPKVAKDLWQKEVNDLPEYRYEQVHLITGALLPIWDRLPTDKARVYRTVTDDGRILLGRVIHPRRLNDTLRNLGAGEVLPDESPSDVISLILDDGYTARLSNGWRVMPRRVSGEHRIEIEGDDLFKFRNQLQDQGVFTERINYKTRFFIPVGENAEKVFAAITSNRPVVEMIPPAPSRSSSATKTPSRSPKKPKEDPRFVSDLPRSSLFRDAQNIAKPYESSLPKDEMAKLPDALRSLLAEVDSKLRAANRKAQGKALSPSLWNEFERILQERDELAPAVAAALEGQVSRFRSEEIERGLKEIEAEAERRVSRTLPPSDAVGILPRGFGVRTPDARSTEYDFIDIDPEIEARWQAAKGIRKETLDSRLREIVDSIYRRATRVFPDLPNDPKYADVRFALLNLRKQRDIAADKTFRLLQSIVVDLSPSEFDLFTRKVILDDLAETDAEGLALPFGFTSDTLAEAKAMIDEAVSMNPRVEAAVAERRKVWNAIKRDYSRSMQAIGFDVEGKLNRDAYYRHQVLDLATLKSSPSGTGGRLRTPAGRGFLRQRVGSYRDINTDYLQAEYEVMAQMIHDEAVARVIKMVDDQHNIAGRLKAAANQENLKRFHQAIEGDQALEDELSKQNQKIRFGFSQLQELAELGYLPTGPRGEYVDVVRRWARGEEESAQSEIDPDVERNRVFRYLAYLASDESLEGNYAARSVLKGVALRRRLMDQVLGENKVDWRDTLPEGYELWQPREGDVWYFADSIPAHIAEYLWSGAFEELGISKDNLQKVLARGGRRTEYAIPQELAITLDTLVRPDTNNVVLRAMKASQTGWKVWQLISPPRYARHNLRNFSSDFDATVIANPNALKFLPQAIQELKDVYFGNRALSESMRAWRDRGGMQTLLQVQEMGDINQLSMFLHLQERRGTLAEIPTRAWQGYWKSARLSTDFREAILRYANFLSYRDQIQSDLQAGGEGRPRNFGASDRREIMALSDPDDRAFALSNQLLVAYDEISDLGHSIREYFIPFWSWQEGNLKRYIGLFKNAAEDGHLATAVGKKVLRKAANPYTYYRVGKFAILALGMWAALEAWNRVMFPDLVDLVPDHVKEAPYIILGQQEDGTVIYFNNLGSVADFLGWFGLNTLPRHARDFLDGKKSIGQIAVDMAADGPMQKVILGTSPFFVAPVEAMLKRQLFPDWRNPRQIRDRGHYLFDQFGLGPEYLKLMGVPSKYRTLASLVAYEGDPTQWAYSAIRDEVHRFAKERGKNLASFSEPTERSTALYNLRQALRIGDRKAAEKYLVEYAIAGGTRQGLQQSLRNMHPLAGLSLAEQRAFLAQLDERQKRQYALALEYFQDFIEAFSSVQTQGR